MAIGSRISLITINHHPYRHLYFENIITIIINTYLCLTALRFSYSINLLLYLACSSTQKLHFKHKGVNLLRLGDQNITSEAHFKTQSKPYCIYLKYV